MTITTITGLTPVTANTSYSGILIFANGASLQPANGVTVTLSGVEVQASHYQQIFDQSQGGTFAGVIANEYLPCSWYGVLPNTTCGAQAQEWLNTPLCRWLKPMRGLYHMDRALTCTDHHIYWGDHLPADTSNFQADTDGPLFWWQNDLGPGVFALTIQQGGRALSQTKIGGFLMFGPGNFGLAPGSTSGCQMDGINWGNNTGMKFIANDGLALGFRFNNTAWTINGHNTLTNWNSSNGFAGWNFIQTGGDWKWNNCSSNNELQSAFYSSKNTGMGVHADIDGYFVSYTPYVAYQSNTVDTRAPGTATAGFIAASHWKRVAAEALGNAFINLTPSDSSLYMLQLQATGWDSLMPYAPVITSEPQDYAIKVNYIEGLNMDLACDSGGAGTLAPFHSGVILTGPNSYGISALGLHVPPAPLPFVTGTSGWFSTALNLWTILRPLLTSLGL
jgi:hypothetical protein